MLKIQNKNGTHHQSSQHGKSGGEVIPGDGQLSVDAGELQDEYKQGDAEAEAPGEHAPRPEGVCTVAHWRHQAEGDTGEDHLQYPHDAHGHRQCPEVQGNHGDCNPVVGSLWLWIDI